MTANNMPVLAVDLDGTLLRSDMLYETFWATLGKDWKQVGPIAQALRQGRAELKSYLSEQTDIDAATLPYNAAVIEHVRSYKAAGGRTALVTASDQTLADEIAKHLGIFDEVHGSNGTTNLKGSNKAEFLTRAYGEQGFSYMGDSSADLVVWPHAALAITVNAPAAVLKSANGLSVPVEHISDAPATTKDYIKALRPHQWMKNLLVFLPMITAQAFSASNFFLSLLAFIAFSLVASSVYVLNDLLDLSADRAHPRKCKRPFAAGRIPITHGTVLAAGLLAIGFVISLFVGAYFTLVMAAYYFVTFAYSMTLKRRTIIDICVLAGLYTIRVVAGGAATGIALSVWLLAFAIFLFFSLAAVKRMAELVDNRNSGKTNITGRGYVVDDIPIVQSMAIGAGYVSVLVMALYVNAPTTLVAYSTPEALWGICCVLLYWITRTVFLAHRGLMDDDPVIYAVKDKISRFCFVLILLFALFGVVV